MGGVDNFLVLAGAIPAALLALAADASLGWLEHKLTVAGGPPTNLGAPFMTASSSWVGSNLPHPLNLTPSV